MDSAEDPKGPVLGSGGKRIGNNSLRSLSATQQIKGHFALHKTLH